ncbi:Two-component sensor histidine kinase, contains HisKA and HATPase domains [Mucilaginibacter polytrichastri]|nr:Two-component sensor histidine kinase, contains HisKA and HATPase domains [Mucilaginibacter polytrichastri]
MKDMDIKYAIKQYPLIYIMSMVFTMFVTGAYSLPQQPGLKVSRDTFLVRQIKVLTDSAAYLFGMPKAGKENFARAQKLYDQALLISNGIHSPQSGLDVMLLKGQCYYFNTEIKPGDSCFSSALEGYKKLGDKHARGMALLTWAKFKHDYESAGYKERIRMFSEAQALFKQTGDRLNEIYAFKYIADVNLCYGKFDLAKQQLLQVVADYKKIHYPDLIYTYDLLAAISISRGETEQVLYYNMQMIKSMDDKRFAKKYYYFCYKIGDNYLNIGLPSLSTIYYKKALEAVPQFNDVYSLYLNYFLLDKVITSMILEHHGQAALAFLINYIKDAPDTDVANAFINKDFGICYQELHRYAEAETYYLKMIPNMDNGSLKFIIPFPIRFESYRIIADFYVLTKRFKFADKYLQVMSASKETGHIAPLDLSKFYLLKFKVDSAAGNYIRGIRYLHKYNQITDSLFSVTKSRQIAELQIKYNTAKKEQDIRLRDKDIALLKKQKRSSQLTLLGGVILSLILLGAGYNRYRYKQRSNLQLQKQQSEISIKNQSLEKLLSENEWLLREVHHRVKNNLQIIIGLLISQTVYLKDEVALDAVLQSQQRIQAMALIHQKLYRSPSISVIFMPEYINDLIDYLKDCFQIGNSVLFKIDVEDISLDVAKTISIGLILNELITNAVKYAFGNTAHGVITIEMFSLENGRITLLVADNGCGLPGDFDTDRSETFGMKLIRGLAGDLEAEYLFENKEGTACSIVFDNGSSTHTNEIPNV